jgi:hypothetical protein
MDIKNIIARFLDVGEEPTQVLTPIEGYEKKPLVSLEESTQQIKNLLHDIDKMLWITKCNSTKPANDLTQEESAAIHLYTMQWSEGHNSLYDLLNKRLRSAHRDSLRPWFSYLKLIITALYKLPSKKMVVWRGVRGNLSDEYDTDKIWWGFSSCTETIDVIERFIGNSGKRTIFMIECMNGKAIQPHSYFKDENEILLMPGTYLRVMNKFSPGNDLYMIQLQETAAPYELIKPPFIAQPSPLKTSLPSNITTLTENMASVSVTTVQPKSKIYCALFFSNSH